MSHPNRFEAELLNLSAGGGKEESWAWVTTEL